MAGPGARIAALISDVDGTLVRTDKSLSAANRAAARRLCEAGVALAIVSSRPPRGLAYVIEALGVSTLVAGFNGGVIATPELEVLEQHLLAPELAQEAARALEASGADVWVFAGQDWLIRDPDGANVAREILTVGFGPTVVADFGAALDQAAKLVGVSSDPDLLVRCEAELSAQLSGSASVARSQSYYLDVTHALANKGEAVRAIARRLGAPLNQVAVIGDGANDVAMFAAAGFSIAMGNAEPAVQAAADCVTAGADHDGFAKAVERFILGGEAPLAARAGDRT